MKKDNNLGNKTVIETLEINDLENDKTNIKDIPSSFFKPIDEIQEQQQTLFKEYEGEQKIASSSVDLSNEIRKLEIKLNKKRFYIPFIYVVILVIIVNLIWFFGVKFLIVPKYEKYIEQNEEIRQNYDSLKRKVDAIVGE